MASMPLGPHHHQQAARPPHVGAPPDASLRPDPMQTDKEMSPAVIEGNNAVNGHIISTTIGGKNGEPKQTISYMAERVVGNGSFGIVFQAKCLETGETVAIKKVLQDRRYKNRELQLMRLMDHPNVVGLKHCFFSTTSNDELFLNLVMEYVPETMYGVLRHYNSMNQRMPLIYVKLYTYQIFRGLAYLHSVPGVCHRDLKPQNLLVDPLTHQVKICDFGSAKVLVKGEANISYICSRYYRAPELIFGATEYTSSIDRERATMGGGGGGRGRSRTQRRHFAQSRENTWKRHRSDPSDANHGDGNSDKNGGEGSNPTWQPFATQNPAFDEYYKEQAIVPPEEWDTFIDYLRKPLPSAFRINSSSQFCMDIKSQLENDFVKSLQSEFVGGDEVEAIRPLPWYPENLGWHSNFSRMQLRKNQTLERFHEFLKLENEIGNITRQEAVSMVPPLFLDVHPDHFVLDMCAAPGSKTFQLLEIIHHSTRPGILPDGLVLANDLDVQRCNLLIHQTKRMCTANLVVTNHEAQHFPGCRSNKNCFGAPEVSGQLEACLNQLLFDRVLCDVPCSGDGTLRKAPDIWRKWNSGMGNGLHGLQVQIALRGLSLLKVGGKMVYSTCSMNPIENEAVVAEILRRHEGYVELVDVSSELPQLIRRPGLRKWKVRDKGVWLTSYKDAAKSRKAAVIPSMFPSGGSSMDPIDHTLGKNHQNGQVTEPEDDNKQLEKVADLAADLEEISNFPLERCMRIVPHDQNGGAFFIAVLCKIAPFPASVQKPISKKGKLTSEKDHLPEELQDKGGEHVDGLGDNSADALDEKVLEAASDHADGSETAVLEADPSNTFGDGNNSSEEVGLYVNGGTDQVDAGGKRTDQVNAGGKRKLQIQGKWKGVDPIVFFKDEAVVNSIKTFYGIVESFPFYGHLVTRNEDTNHVKRIYYISKSVKELLELNLQVGQPLKIASVGLKMFERQSSIQGTSAPCSFRISSEGLPLLLPYITKQILYASLVDFKHLLQYKSIKFSDFVDSEFRSRALELQPGCCVIVLRDEDDKSSLDLTADRIAIGCWKGKASLSLLVTAIDCQELLERLVARKETSMDSALRETETTSDNVTDEAMDEIEKPEDA